MSTITLLSIWIDFFVSTFKPLHRYCESPVTAIGSGKDRNDRKSCGTCRPTHAASVRAPVPRRHVCACASRFGRLPSTGWVDLIWGEGGVARVGSCGDVDVLREGRGYASLRKKSFGWRCAAQQQQRSRTKRESPLCNYRCRCCVSRQPRVALSQRCSARRVDRAHVNITKPRPLRSLSRASRYDVKRYPLFFSAQTRVIAHTFFFRAPWKIFSAAARKIFWGVSILSYASTNLLSLTSRLNMSSNT